MEEVVRLPELGVLGHVFCERVVLSSAVEDWVAAGKRMNAHGYYR